LVTEFEVKAPASIPKLTREFLNALSVWAYRGERCAMPGQGGEPEKDKRKRRKRSDGEEAAKQREKAAGRSRGDILLAIAHPLRRRILRKLGKRAKPTSPTQLADELGGPLGKIAYHVRVLGRLGALSAAGQQQVRGAVEHFYVSRIENDPPIETLLEETKKEDEEEE
jgi:DNA-binding transcriptional ArsR family regulator